MKKSTGAFINFIPEGFDSSKNFLNSKSSVPWIGNPMHDRYSSSQISHDELPQYSGRSVNSNKTKQEENEAMQINIRSNAQQSEEKVKIVHDERYEGSSASREEIKSPFTNDLKDSWMNSNDSETNSLHETTENHHDLPFQKNIF